VLQHSPNDFIMLPEIYTKIGQVELGLRRPRQAELSFGKAIAHKADYWPAYFQWAEYLRSSGQKAKAKQLVAEGLAYSPDAKPLQELYKLLGGNPSEVKAKTPLAGVPRDAAAQAPPNVGSERATSAD
jgi:hypothetical protein